MSAQSRVMLADIWQELAEIRIVCSPAISRKLAKVQGDIYRVVCEAE